MGGDLGTTNMWLAIMAIVSVLEALLLIGIGVAGFLMYRRVMQLVNDLETRQITPVREKVDAILLDVKAVTANVTTAGTSRPPRRRAACRGRIISPMRQAIGRLTD